MTIDYCRRGDDPPRRKRGLRNARNVGRSSFPKYEAKAAHRGSTCSDASPVGGKQLDCVKTAQLAKMKSSRRRVTNNGPRGLKEWKQSKMLMLTSRGRTFIFTHFTSSLLGCSMHRSSANIYTVPIPIASREILQRRPQSVRSVEIAE